MASEYVDVSPPSVKWLEGKFDALDRRLDLLEGMLRQTATMASPAEAMMALGYWVTVLQEVS